MGNAYWSQYDTAASGDVEAILEYDNVTAVDGYDDSGTSNIIYATSSGITALTRTSAGVSTKKGYFPRADINEVAHDDTYCYVAFGVANASGGLGRITLANLFASDSDQTANFDGDWGKDNSAFRSAADSACGSVSAALVGAVYYLAYTYYAYGTAGFYRDVGIRNLTTGTSYRAYGTFGACKVAIATGGDIVASRGGQIYVKSSVASIAANDWFWDQISGDADDDITSGVLSPIFGIGPASGVVLNSGYVSIDYTPATDSWTAAYQSSMFLTGDFDLQITGLGGTEPALGGANDWMQRFINIVSTTSTGDTISSSFHRKYNAVVPNQRTETSGTIIFGGSTVVNSTTAQGGGALTAAVKDWRLRVVRAGSSVSCYYDIGAGWVQEGATYATWHTGQVAVQFCQSAISLNAQPCGWDIYRFTNATPDSNYSMFANGGDLIQDMDAITVSASNLTVAVSFDELNTQVLDWDKTTANSSTIKTFGASGSGADYEILSDSTVYAVALAANATTAAGYVWIATDSGLDYVDLSDDSVLTLTTTYGKIINDAVDSLCVISSITYGVTTALSAAGGAGFAAMSDIGAPADTNLVVRGFNNDDLLVGFEVPTESDRDHAKLYARKNGGQWNYLLTTGVLATSGTAFEFDTTGYEAFLTCQLKDLANGKYEVKVTQFDTIGNESTGTTETEYLDEPNATILVNGGSAQTRTRAVLLDLSGDSGDDSLAEANQIYEWKVKEDSQAWSAAIIYRNPSMGTAQTVPFYIPGAAGLKTLQVKGYDRAGNESAIDSTTTTFFSPYEGNTTTFNHDDVIHIAWELGSDSATLGSYSDYDAATYPVANLQDPRLAKVWRGSVTKTVQCMAQFDLGTSPGQTDIFYMKNHDLAYYDDNGAKIKIYLCAHATNLGTPTSWLTNATYKVELTNLIHMHSICHRPEVTYQQWAVIVEVGSLVFLGTATPYFGRMILAQTAGIWKPTNSNFDNDIRLTLNDNSIVNESEDQTLEAVERDKQLIADLSFENMTEADTQSFRQVYSELGHSHDCLVLLRPSDFDTGTTEPSAWDGTNYIMPPLYSQIADVGDFRHVANGRWNFDVEFREIIGGRSPYGMRTSD